MIRIRRECRFIADREPEIQAEIDRERRLRSQSVRRAGDALTETHAAPEGVAPAGVLARVETERRQA